MKDHLSGQEWIREIRRKKSAQSLGLKETRPKCDIGLNSLFKDNISDGGNSGQTKI